MGSDGNLRGSYANKINPDILSKIVSRANMKPGDILFSAADTKIRTAQVALGAVRLEVAKKLDVIPKDTYAITWITDFPLFEFSEEENRYVAMHHPFTSPKDEDLEYMKTSPDKVRAKAYDLVINGDEMGGGSLRIFNQQVQKLMFETIGLTDEQIVEKFGYFVEAFKYGTPPHGGLAFGFDRLMMLLCGTDNIKDVIAFPKIQNASCMMSDAPNTVDEKQLEELCIMYHEYKDNK
jgi:Aspartyl-tRNA synthetase